MGSNGPFLLHLPTDKVTSFEGRRIFTIGRCVESSLDIPSKFISRNQCKIEYLDGVGWVLYDNSKFKSTKLNDFTLKNEYGILQDGDKISFSAGAPEFLFFTDDNFIPKKRSKISEFEECLQPCSSRTTDIIPNATDSVSNTVNVVQELKKDNELLNQRLMCLTETKEATEMAISLYEIENKALQAKLREMENTDCRNKYLEEKVKEVELKSSEITSELTTVSQKYKDLESNLSDVKENIKFMSEDLTDAQVEIDRLLDERCCKMLNFGRKNEPIKESDKMEIDPDILTTVEYDLLKEELDTLSTKYEQQGHLLAACLAEKEDCQEEKAMFLAKINDVIDSELYCTICSELLCEAILLNCKHTFCKACIDEWKKNKRDCPVCRTKIKTEISSLTIDSLIDKMAETIGGELKSHREEVKRNRARAPRSNKRKRTERDRVHMDPFLNMFGIAPSFVVIPPIPEVVDLTSTPDRRNSRRSHTRRSRRQY